MEQKKYSIIYADPAWSFNNKNTGGSMISGASAHYDVMTLQGICNLPIHKIAADDCVLFMWWVASQPAEALKVVDAWGFKLKTMTGFNWVKTTKNGLPHFGMGFWTRAGSENCLIAVKGRPKRVNAAIRSVVTAENEQHSKKPDIFRQKIVALMGDLPRVELFARQKAEGWDAWGNEVISDINL
jgi:N6-adenosine-specific RNA methylase IME4